MRCPWPSAGGGGHTPDVQVFVTTGVWTPPAWATWCQAMLIGGGGGGGSGAYEDFLAQRQAGGGSGGGSGAYNEAIFLISWLLNGGVSLTVWNPGGGAGGAERSGALGIDGANGADGGDVILYDVGSTARFCAIGGKKGIGGTRAGVAAVGGLGGAVPLLVGSAGGDGATAALPAVVGAASVSLVGQPPNTQ